MFFSQHLLFNRSGPCATLFQISFARLCISLEGWEEILKLTGANLGPLLPRPHRHCINSWGWRPSEWVAPRLGNKQGPGANLPLVSLANCPWFLHKIVYKRYRGQKTLENCKKCPWLWHAKFPAWWHQPWAPCSPPPPLCHWFYMRMVFLSLGPR